MNSINSERIDALTAVSPAPAGTPHGLLIFGGALALLSLLTLLKAPINILWIAALALTEWGHFIWLIPAGLFFFAGSRATPDYWTGGYALLSVILLWTPLLRALPVARHLPDDLRQAFGNAPARLAEQAPARAHAISLRDLFLGVSSPPVSMESYVYANTKAGPLSMDLYHPRGPASLTLPAVLIVHGGSWKTGSRKEFQPLNRYLAARGYLVAAIDYRLAPGSTFPAAREDIFAAIDYLTHRASALGWDGRQLVIVGRSAGGQIALSAAYAGKYPVIKGAIVYYTPNDLVLGYTVPGNPLIINSRKVISDYLGGTLQQVPQAYEDASPLRAVNSATPPTLMIHGVRDELVWAIHEDRLSAQLKKAGRPYYYLRLPWATHGCDINFSGPSGQLSTFAVERFLANVMPHKESV